MTQSEALIEQKGGSNIAEPARWQFRMLKRRLLDFEVVLQLNRGRFA